MAEAGLVDHDATDLLNLRDHKLGVGEMGECAVAVDCPTSTARASLPDVTKLVSGRCSTPT